MRIVRRGDRAMAPGSDIASDDNGDRQIAMRNHCSQRSAPLRHAITGFVVAFGLAMPASGAEADLEGFKAEIEAFIGRLGPSSNGVVKWAGSDPYEIRRDGSALVAVIRNVRLALGTNQVDGLSLDRI